MALSEDPHGADYLQKKLNQGMCIYIKKLKQKEKQWSRKYKEKSQNSSIATKRNSKRIQPRKKEEAIIFISL